MGFVEVPMILSSEEEEDVHALLRLHLANVAVD
jgi:hypothetical protein